jgi:hypothetical protein
MLFHRHYSIVGAGWIIPTAWWIKGRDENLPKPQKGQNSLLQGANLFLPFCLLLFIIALPLLVDIRARKPLLRLRLRLEMRVIFLCVAIFYLQNKKGAKAPAITLQREVL